MSFKVKGWTVEFWNHCWSPMPSLNRSGLTRSGAIECVRQWMVTQEYERHQLNGVEYVNLGPVSCTVREDD